MEKSLNFEKISKDKFEFVQQDAKLFDAVPETKPVGYYKDAFRRFKKNKASVVAACIILFLMVFSIVVPLISPFGMDFAEDYYKNMPAKNFLSSATVKKTEALVFFEADLALSVGVNHFEATGKTIEEANALGIFSNVATGRNHKYSPILSGVTESKIQTPEGLIDQFTYKYDKYKGVGFRWKEVSTEEYEKMKAWQEETGLPLLYPVVNLTNDPSQKAMLNANIWYKHNGKDRAYAPNSTKTRSAYDEFEPNYRLVGGVIQDRSPSGTSLWTVRLLVENWFIYEYGKEPVFFLGTDGSGRDILVRLAKAVQTSFILGIAITALCFVIGSIIGALMGYYGGWFDLGMGRVMEIMSGIPGMVVLILMKLRFIETGVLSAMGALLAYFMIFGWLGDAGAMRNQFYRFKHQEYVLASRTLGAKDRRIMFKHILPNSWGTIITGLALSIPGVVGLEGTLAYLGILRIDGPDRASLGAMLSEGSKDFTTYPHIVFWPSLVLALLMISFNLFGNGLRDAFNPQLRGVEE